MENHRILIVEDDEAIAGAVSRIIESWGLTPRCVRDFRDVLREFTDFDPHLVLMDITLPFFNGYLQSTVHIWCFWISRFLFIMDTTGAARSEKYPPCRSFSSPARRKI